MEITKKEALEFLENILWFSASNFPIQFKLDEKGHGIVQLIQRIVYEWDSRRKDNQSFDSKGFVLKDEKVDDPNSFHFTPDKKIYGIIKTANAGMVHHMWEFDWEDLLSLGEWLVVTYGVGPHKKEREDEDKCIK